MKLRSIIFILSVAFAAILSVAAQRTGAPKVDLKNPFPAPVLERIKIETNVKDYADKAAAIALTLSVSNWSSYSDDLFAPSSDLPACSTNKSAARTFFNLYDYQTDEYVYGWCGLIKAENIKTQILYIYRAQKVPDCIYAALEDRKTGKKAVSNPISVQGNKPCVKPEGKP